jgi:hypothetical protein
MAAIAVLAILRPEDDPRCDCIVCSAQTSLHEKSSLREFRICADEA